VTILRGEDWAVTDLLPAEAFFLGCEEPDPPGFTVLAETLRHINLAGRPCGVFSAGSEGAWRYLAGLVRDCEAVLCPWPLQAGDPEDLKGWLNF